MEKYEAEEKIRTFVTNHTLVSYFCAEKKATLAIWEGEMAIGESVTTEIKKDKPLCAIKCPGWEHFLPIFVIEDLEFDEDTELFYDYSGREFELEDAIWDYMDRNEMEERKEHLIRELLDDWEDRNDG